MGSSGCAKYRLYPRAAVAFDDAAQWGSEAGHSSWRADTAPLAWQEGEVRAQRGHTGDGVGGGGGEAQAGAGERMARALGKTALCIVSGGAGRALSEQLGDTPCRYVDNLVLEGLARIAAS